MSTSAETVYAEQIKPLPREVQLQVASLILQAMVEAEAGQAKESISFETVLAHSSEIHIRSPRLLTSPGATPPEVRVVEQLDE